jgi:peptidoglycan/xylan/chitin deacetylase (PgdA/CDA1 family)
MVLRSPPRTHRSAVLTLVLSLIAVLAACAPQHTGSPAAAVPPHAAASSKYVVLTFDDGPDSKYTPEILDILGQYGVKATFFEVGREVKKHPDLTRRLSTNGHSVENHTWSHPDLRKLSAPSFDNQVETTDQYIREQTGQTPRCLRPPYGGTNSVVAKRAANLGKSIVLWTIDSRDWTRPGEAAIVRRVLTGVRSGSVILMHDGGGNRSQTVAALPTILKTLKARGYTFRLACP